MSGVDKVLLWLTSFFVGFGVCSMILMYIEKRKHRD